MANERRSRREPERGRGRAGGRAGGRDAGRGSAGRGKPSGGKAKRTSKNSDDRNPTKSGIDYPSRKYKTAGPPEPEKPKARSSLRKVARTADEPAKKTRNRRAPAKKTGTPRRRHVKTTEASQELAHLAGRNARKAQEQLARAADAFLAGRERDAARLLRPLRDAYPDAGAVRELLGLCHYRLGQFNAAAKELEAFVEITDSVEQHPVLMDCYRAMAKYRRIDELWEELATASPSSALVTEGRIVLAGSRADRKKVREAIDILERKSGDVKRVQEHHLRLWYALADLYERAGEIPRARDLFLRVRRNDASFADVAERLAALA